MKASCASPTSARSLTSGWTGASAASAARSQRKPVTNQPRVYQKKYSAAASRCAGQEPAKGRVVIGPVELQQVALLLGPRREQQRLGCLGPGQERAGVPPPGQGFLPGIGQ